MQTSQLVCSLAGQRCLEAWGTLWTWKGQNITELIAWWKEEYRKGAANFPPSEVGNDLKSNLTNSDTVRGQPWEDCYRAECELAFPSPTMPSWAETELLVSNTGMIVQYFPLGSIRHFTPAVTWSVVSTRTPLSHIQWDTVNKKQTAGVGREVGLSKARQNSLVYKHNLWALHFSFTQVHNM